MRIRHCASQPVRRRGVASRVRWSVPVALAALALAWLTPAPAHAASVPDLLPNINILETNLADTNIVRKQNSCGVASAAMVLDYYQLDYRFPGTAKPITIDDVARYVTIHVGEGGYGVGTYPSEVQSGLVAAEAALHPDLPLSASLRTTDGTHW